MIPIIFILLLALLQLRLKVRDACLESIEDGNDALLFGERGKKHSEFSKMIRLNSSNLYTKELIEYI